MKTDYQLENEIDDSTIWFKDGPPVYFSGVSRFRRWLFPGLTATIILILIIALGASSSAADGCCPPGWDQFGFNCFFFSFESLSWNESRIWCENHEAHLVIIHKDQTWALGSRSARQLGRSRSGTRRRGLRSPAQNGGRLNDLHCSTRMRFICQEHSIIDVM
ncbi:uncharacterized protein LOC142943444 isoform X2 [Anarhichas minor]|uniref:uncharacterized protein LOC142943444 isoform X2 n=1 Tax=Anarhichas minor TaxID=65739 RepID=UPI003F73C3D7